MKMKMDWQDAEFLLELGRNLRPVRDDVPAVGKFRVIYEGGERYQYFREFSEARSLAFAWSLTLQRHSIVDREVTKGTWEMATEFYPAGRCLGGVEVEGGVS